ncbi:tRNA glutamyl-Q(34) synthetase GluQRS [Brachybacterium sp. MASK1Z-5]|uniref:Glutamyl-Q tRNA(Asp) synthetase n=1 Tax=Brachybacterium halotolerans TaxID=2795215 RepID=A0ABS1BDC5_9MICO|nr:tRNA glutamyl-Q(34) synthetase GluQRS [Brachybacterium halotolerans]MBK0332649.1 tRNA glutamyl-Q(34) synthetase GluQRS [Brachybacterium halotolerans]
MPDVDSPAGRYAPSPSGDLHLGNLRTAILAWVLARGSGRAFRLRVEDLDRVREGAEERQLEDLEAIGLDWDGHVMHQSRRAEAYDAALGRLADAGLVYECYCTRREILEAPSAPHAPPGAYPGTCRDLEESARERGRARMRELRREPALRLRAGVAEWAVHDMFAGEVTGTVDDLVLRRGDGVVAYNLAVVVDDAAQGVDQVVRADDLLSSAPRQAYLAHLLGGADLASGTDPATSAGPATSADRTRAAAPDPTAPMEYAHVPLAVSPSGARLAKRDGAVTLRDRLERGEDVGDVVGRIGASLGLEGCRSAPDVLERWDPATLPREPWVVDLPA